METAESSPHIAVGDMGITSTWVREDKDQRPGKLVWGKAQRHMPKLLPFALCKEEPVDGDP